MEITCSIVETLGNGTPKVHVKDCRIVDGLKEFMASLRKVEENKKVQL